MGRFFVSGYGKPVEDHQRAQNGHVGVPMGGNVADTGKHDGHAESGMFIMCGERDTLQMPKRASATYLKGGRWGRGEV